MRIYALIFNFNPRSLTGATKDFGFRALDIIFQSTLPHGSDLFAIVLLILVSANFNPRSLAGATCCSIFTNAGLIISIHAPLRERLKHKQVLEVLFQSTLPRWSDHLQRLVQDNRNHFNPRSIAGATVLCPRAAIAWADFNPRSLAGATYPTAHYR